MSDTNKMSIHLSAIEVMATDLWGTCESGEHYFDEVSARLEGAAMLCSAEGRLDDAKDLRMLAGIALSRYRSL